MDIALALNLEPCFTPVESQECTGRAAQRSAIVVGFSAPERALAEFARVLTPKGRVALSWWDGVGRLGGAEVCEPAQISLPVGGSESCLTRRCARRLQKPARGGYWQQ